MSTTFQPPPTYALPILVNPQTQEMVFNPIWLRWFLDLVKNLGTAGAGSGTVISVTAGAGLSGGTIQTSGTIAFTGPVNLATQVSGILANTHLTRVSATITTAKLTGGGANGSMTFTNGLLTAQTPAT